MYSKRRPDRNASSAAPKSKALTFCCHHYDLDLDILDHVCACNAYKPSSLHVSPTKDINMKTQKKMSKNDGARHVDLWHDVSQMFSCLHEIHPNQLCQIIRPQVIEEEFFWRHLQQIPPTPGGRKSESHWSICLSESVECRSAFRCHEGRWHWGRGCRPYRRRRTFHRPRRSRPMCGYCALRAPFRSGTADSSDWPGESVAKIQSRYAFYNFFPTSSPPLRHL